MVERHPRTGAKLTRWQREITKAERAPANEKEVQWLSDFCRAMHDRNGRAWKPGDRTPNRPRVRNIFLAQQIFAPGGRQYKHLRQEERSSEDRSRDADGYRRGPADRSPSPSIDRTLERRGSPRTGRYDLTSYQPEAQRGLPSRDSTARPDSRQEHRDQYRPMSPLSSQQDERGDNMSLPSLSKGNSVSTSSNSSEVVGTKRKLASTSPRQIESQKRASTSGAAPEEPQSIMRAPHSQATRSPVPVTIDMPDTGLKSSHAQAQLTSGTEPFLILPQSAGSQLHADEVNSPNNNDNGSDEVTAPVEKGPQLQAELAHAQSNRILPQLVRKLRETISKRADQDEPTASSMARILEVFDEEAKESSARSYGRKISENSGLGQCLHEGDLLSMYWDGTNDTAAWYTDAVVNALIEVDLLKRQILEFENPSEDDTARANKTFYWTEANTWLLVVNEDEPAKELTKYNAMISTARIGEEPQIGWPLAYLNEPMERIFCALNPVGNHWVGIEIEVADPPTFRLYNSMLSESGIARAQFVCKKMQKTLEIASLRPGSPLHGKAWHASKHEVVDCAQQGNMNIDCGPFAVYFILQRMRNLPVAGPDLPSDAHRHAFGQWLRGAAIQSLERAFVADAVWTFGEIVVIDTLGLQRALESVSDRTTPTEECYATCHGHTTSSLGRSNDRWRLP